MTTNFNLEKALKALQSGQDLTGKDGLLTPLIKQLTEAALKTELEQHLQEDEQPNRKNGSSRKTVKSSAKP
jgi:transposase-like protein